MIGNTNSKNNRINSMEIQHDEVQKEGKSISRKWNLGNKFNFGFYNVFVNFDKSALVLGLTFSLFLMASSWTQAAEQKVGIVDMSKAIQATKAGKKAKETLDKEFSKRKEVLDKKKADIEKMGQDLEKKKSVLSEEVLSKKQAELQEEMMKFQKTVGENQMEISKKEKELLDPILEKMKKVMEKVSKDKGFSLVLEKTAQNVLFALNEIDLTDALIEQFEKEK